MPSTEMGCCRACAREGKRTKLIENQQVHPFCPKCDRLQCGQCKVPILHPKASNCPNGHPIRSVAPPPE
jgi:hypothetical protein